MQFNDYPAIHQMYEDNRLQQPSLSLYLLDETRTGLFQDAAVATQFQDNFLPVESHYKNGGTGMCNENNDVIPLGDNPIESLPVCVPFRRIYDYATTQLSQKLPDSDRQVGNLFQHLFSCKAADTPEDRNVAGQKVDNITPQRFQESKSQFGDLFGDLHSFECKDVAPTGTTTVAKRKLNETMLTNMPLDNQSNGLLNSSSVKMENEDINEEDQALSKVFDVGATPKRGGTYANFVSTLNKLSLDSLFPEKFLHHRGVLFRWNTSFQNMDYEYTGVNTLLFNLYTFHQSDDDEQLPKGALMKLTLADEMGKFHDWVFIAKSSNGKAGNGLFAAKEFQKDNCIGYHVGDKPQLFMGIAFVNNFSERNFGPVEEGESKNIRMDNHGAIYASRRIRNGTELLLKRFNGSERLHTACKKSKSNV